MLLEDLEAWLESGTPGEMVSRYIGENATTQDLSDIRRLRRYASSKALAMDARLDGNIDLAIRVEKFCDRLYEKLPERLRW